MRIHHVQGEYIAMQGQYYAFAKTVPTAIGRVVAQLPKKCKACKYPMSAHKKLYCCDKCQRSDK